MKTKRTNILTAALRAGKTKSRRFGFTQILIGTALISLVGQQANAQTDIFWDNGGVGTGTWDTTSTNWDSLANLAGTNQVWADGSDANFQTVNGGTVTLAAVHRVNNLSASSGGAGPHNWVLQNNPLSVTGTAEVSAATQNNLTIASGIAAPAAGQSLSFATGGTGTITVSGNIFGTIGAVTSNAALTLSGTNAFTGPLSVGSGTTTLAGGAAVLDTTAVNLTGSSTLALSNSETIGALTGAAGTNINLGTRVLTVNQNSNTNYGGAITGTAAANNAALAKTGTGSLTLSGANTYTGLTNINAGAIIATTNTALGATGAGNGTVVASGATVALQGGFTTAEDFTIAGAGAAPFAGAIDSTGGNTITGQISMIGSPATINSASGTLTITGGVTSTVLLGQDVLTFSGPGNIDLAGPGVITGSVEAIRKIGTGTLDLSGVNNDYINIGASGQASASSIVDGKVVVDNDNNLGSQSGGAIQGVSFDGIAGQTPTLQVIQDIDFRVTGRDFRVNGPLGQFSVDATKTATVNNADLSFSTATNTLRQIGAGTLVIDASASGVGNVATIAGILDAPAGTLSVLGAGFSGLNPSFGPGGVPLPGSTTLKLSGLGSAAGGQAGTINLGVAGNEFDNILINQSINTTFAGTLNTTGDLTVTGTGQLKLTGVNNIGGNIHLAGKELVVSNAGSLGSNINSHDQQATFIWGRFIDETIPQVIPSLQTQGTPGMLSLSGGVAIDERLTIVNDGRINNASGTNNINSAVRIRLDGSLAQAPIAPPYAAQIGATDGTLNLVGGVFSNPGQNVVFNGLNTDTGIVNVGVIQSTVADVSMGNTANTTNTVILGAANSYSGNTAINGGKVVVGNSLSFSGSSVTVNANANLDSNGNVAVANGIANNATLTTGTSGNTLALNGTITGAGGITNAGGSTTLGGTNTYSGATLANAGTLTITGSINGSNNVQVASSAILSTTGADKLSDGAVVLVAATGTANLGGNETVNTLTSSGTVTVSGNLAATAAITANAGTIGATGNITTNALTSAAGAMVSGVNFNAANIVANGAVTATGDIIATTLNGAATGVVNFGANTLTAQSGAFAGNLVGANGNLVKNGGGTLTLSGNNAGLTGKTTVNSGVLAANALGSTTVDVMTGGTLTASGSFAATNINVSQGGTLNTAGLTAANATVNTSGIVNGAGGANTIANLNINAASGQVNLTGGSLTTGGLNGAGTINLGANNLTASTGNYGGTINGTGSLTKASPGTLTLAGTNAFTGGTIVSGGTLALQSTLASTTVNVNAGTTLTTSGNEQLANGATLTADGTVGLGGAETIGTLNGAGTVNAAGNLTVTALNGSAAINAGANTVTAQNGTFGGSINGNGGLTKNSAGTLSLNAANAYTGTTQVNGGTLDVNATLASQSLNVASGAVLTTSGGNLNNGASLTNNGRVTVEADETVTTYASGGPGANNGLLDGAGRLTASTYNLNDGSDVTANLGTGIVNSNGTVSINNTTTNANAINVQTGTLTAAGTFAATNIGVNSGATLQSNGILAANANMVVGGTANINGATTVQTLSVTPASGIVNLVGGNLTTTNLNGSGLIALNANTLTASSGTFSGTINGGGGLTKNGAGMTLTLSGSNDYTGVTNVNAGTLAIESDLASLTLNIANGATLSTNANELLANTATVNTNASGTLNLGGNETIGLLNGNGSVVLGTNTLTLTAGGNFGGNIGGTGEIILAGGTLTVNSVGGLNADDLDIQFGTGLTTTAANLIGNNTDVNNDGTLTLGGTDTVGTYTSTGTLNGSTLTASTYALKNGSIVNANTGPGVMTSNGTVNINSANTGAGVLTVQSGVLTAGDAVGDTFAAAQVTVSANSTLNSNGTFTNLPTLEVSGLANLNTVTNLTGLGVNAPGLVEINAASLTTLNLSGDGTVDLNANTFNVSQGAFSGTLLGTGTLNKNGAGLLSLSGTNSYSGPTNVNAGTLNAVTALNTSAVNVTSGATYLNTGGLINPNVSISNNGTVTLFGNEQASVYNSAGGTLNGVGTLTAPTYNLSNGANTAQGANLGTGVLNSGPGTVTLLGNSAANDANVLSGTFNVGGNLGSAGATVDISGGATLALLLNPGLSINGDIVDTAIVNNAGTLTLSDDELVASYTSGGPNVGNGLLNGTGTLTAATYALNNNSVTVAGANLGDGALTSNGNVLLGGTSDAETVNIQTGNLTLGSANRLADDAAVNNDATLTLNGSDTVGTYTSTGKLNGIGTLTAATYALNNGSVVNANIGLGALTSNGIVQLNGTSAAGTVNIQSGNLTLGSANRLADNAAVNNAATLTLNGSDTVGSYTSTGNLNGNGTLTAATYDLNGGSVVNANIGSGIVTTNGNVALNGTSAANTVNINLGSNLMLGSANRLSDGATVTSAGTLTLNGDDTIDTYTSNGATLAGIGILTATTFDLNHNSVVNFGTTLGDINPGSSRLLTSGNVFLNGTSNVDRVTIESGNLIGGVNAQLNYVNLEGNGTLSLAGNTFTNLAGRTLNPGIYDGDRTGALTINDNFVNRGNLVFDADRVGNFVVDCQLDASKHDTLVVNGTTTLGGSVHVTKLGAEFARGESATLIQGNGDITVNGAAFTHGYSTRNFLVINNGTDTASLLGTGVAGVNGNLANIASLNSNQATIANAVNTQIAGKGNILDTSVGADQIALHVIGDCHTDPGAALNQLSPESYAGFVDYGIQVTKSYTNAALSMPGTKINGSAGFVRIPMGTASSSKESAPTVTESNEASTSVFAGYTHFSTGTDSSSNGADYDIASNGAIFGLRHETCGFTFGGFIGLDQGDVESKTLSADVDGYLLGLATSYLIKPEINLMVTGGITYGNYEFDGTRNTFGGSAKFSGVDSDVFDTHLAIEGDAYSNDKLRVTPFLGLHYVNSDTDAFNESGTVSALLINAQDDDAFFTQIGVKSEYQVNNQFSVNANVSYTHNFSDSERQVNAKLGGTPFAVSAPGLGEDFFTLGIGSQYQVSEAFRLGLNYRAEFSADADTANGVILGGSYSF